MSGITKLHLATLFCYQNDYHGTCIARGTVSMEVTGTRPRDRLDRLESDIPTCASMKLTQKCLLTENDGLSW